jgi:hypothetical protein
MWGQFSPGIKEQRNWCLQEGLLHKTMGGLANRASNAPVNKLSCAFLAKTKSKGTVNRRCVFELLHVINLSNVRRIIHVVNVIGQVYNRGVINNRNSTHMPIVGMASKFSDCVEYIFVCRNGTTHVTTFKPRLSTAVPTHIFSRPWRNIERKGGGSRRPHRGTRLHAMRATSCKIGHGGRYVVKKRVYGCCRFSGGR